MLTLPVDMVGVFAGNITRAVRVGLGFVLAERLAAILRESKYGRLKSFEGKL